MARPLDCFGSAAIAVRSEAIHKRHRFALVPWIATALECVRKSTKRFSDKTHDKTSA